VDWIGFNYVFILWSLLPSFFFFLAYSQPPQIGCLLYFHTSCGISANLECRSMCWTRLAENGRKKSPKIRRLRTVAQLCRAVYLRNYACIDNRKKNLLNSNISSTCSHNMVNFGPLAAEIGLPVWSRPYPSNFNGFRFVTAPTSVNGGHPNFARCRMGWYTIYTFSGPLASNGILQGAKFTVRPSLVFSFILVELLHGNRVLGVSQTLRRWAEGATYIRQIGHHVGHWPTFYSFLMFFSVFGFVW